MRVNLAAPPFSNLIVHGYSLQRALDEFACVTRDTSVVELWSGVGSVASAGEECGLKSLQFDVLRPDVEETEDMLTPQGFRVALGRVMSLEEKGLLHMSPPCGSFVFMNRKNTKRSRENPLGDSAYPPVEQGNLQAIIMIFFFVLALLRSVHPLCEQPTTSQMFSHPVIKHIIDILKPTFAIVARCPFDARDYGKRWLKKFKFMGEGWTSRLRKKCSCPNGVHAPLVLKVMVRAKGKTKKVNVTGKKGELVMSGTFPPNLGRWIVKNWQETKGLDLKDEAAGPKRKCRTAEPKKLVKPKIAKPKVQPKIAKPKKQVQPKTAKPNKATVRKAKQEPASAASSWKALSAAGSGIAASAAGSGAAATTSSWKSLSISSSSSKPASSSGTSWKSLAP